MNEIIYNNKTFRQIPTFDNYYVSRDGEVYSFHRNKILVGTKNPGAVKYPVVFLCKDGISTCHTVHKLVALTWCKLPDDMTAEELLIATKNRVYVVDHIDGDKSNCNANNLRWCTPIENLGFDNWDRTRKCEKLLGNKNAVGKRNYTGPRHTYVYIYNNKEYTSKELAKELKCSKSKITESFRTNGGLVKSGELTRKIIK